MLERSNQCEVYNVLRQIIPYIDNSLSEKPVTSSRSTICFAKLYPWPRVPTSLNLNISSEDSGTMPKTILFHVRIWDVVFWSKLSDLPLEMLELVLMRAFLMLYANGGDDDNCAINSSKSTGSERPAFTLLASVCWNWRQTLIGWPASPTCHWLKHQLKKLIGR